MNREIFVQGMVDEFMKDKGGITSGMDAALQYALNNIDNVVDEAIICYDENLNDNYTHIILKHEFKKT